MATVSMKPGVASITASARTKANIVPEQSLEVPGGLFPMRASTWELDEYRIKQGWPVPVPPGDIRVPTLVSCTGEILTSRIPAGELVTGAFVRFIADPDYFDETTLRWNPVQGGAPVFTFTVDEAPVLITDYEYRVGEERFVEMHALNFDSDSQNYMSLDMTGTIGGTTGYTVIMVMSPNSVYGNDVDVPYNGLWCPQNKTGNWVDFQMQGNYLFMETEAQERQLGVSISEGLGATAPTFLAIVVQRPTTTLYAAMGPSRMLVKSVAAGPAPVPLEGDIYLGRSTEDLLHTADMALFDLGIYPDALNADQVRTEFQLLSKVYGGDS